MNFKAGTKDIQIDIDDIVDTVLETITEEVNNAIYDYDNFNNLDDVDEFFDTYEDEINKMENHVIELVAKKLLED